MENILNKNGVISIRFSKSKIKYANNTFWLLFEKIIRLIIGLFIGVWVARYLGPNDFGILSYAQSFVGLFTVVFLLGLDDLIIRELVKNSILRENLLGTTFLLRTIGLTFGIIILVVLSLLINKQHITNVVIIIIAVSTVFQNFSVIDLYFQSQVLSKYFVFANIITLVLSSSTKIILILSKAGLVYFAIVFLFEAIITAGFYIYFYHKLGLKIFDWHFDKILSLKLLKESWPLALSGIMISFYMKVDQVMIKEFLNEKSVGYYAAAVKISEGFYFIPSVVMITLFPILIKSKKKSQGLYNKQIKLIYTFMVWSAVLIAVPIMIYSKEIILLLFGNKYLLSSEVLNVHVWTAIFVFLGVAFSRWLITEGLIFVALYRTLSGLVTNIVLNIFFIPKWGIIGAAYATLLSQAFANLLYDFFDTNLHDHLKYKMSAFFPFLILSDFFNKKNHINNE